VMKIRPVELYANRGYILCNCMFTSGVGKDIMHTNLREFTGENRRTTCDNK
jgi:hypothetical protein